MKAYFKYLVTKLRPCKDVTQSEECFNGEDIPSMVPGIIGDLKHTSSSFAFLDIILTIKEYA